MIPIDTHFITATIAEFGRMSGLGRSTIYTLLSARELDLIQIGRRRLIVIDSYRRLIERHNPKENRPGNGVTDGKPPTPPPPRTPLGMAAEGPILGSKNSRRNLEKKFGPRPQLGSPASQAAELGRRPALAGGSGMR